MSLPIRSIIEDCHSPYSACHADLLASIGRALPEYESDLLVDGDTYYARFDWRRVSCIVRTDSQGFRQTLLASPDRGRIDDTWEALADSILECEENAAWETHPDFVRLIQRQYHSPDAEVLATETLDRPAAAFAVDADNFRGEPLADMRRAAAHWIKSQRRAGMSVSRIEPGYWEAVEPDDARSLTYQAGSLRMVYADCDDDRERFREMA